MTKKDLEKKTKAELIDMILLLNEKKKGTNIAVAHSAKVVDAKEIYKDRIVIPSSKDKRMQVKLNKESKTW